MAFGVFTNDELVQCSFVFQLLYWHSWAGMLPLHGQNQPTSVDAVPIATDRPAVANSSVVVPPGSLQAEKSDAPVA